MNDARFRSWTRAIEKLVAVQDSRIQETPVLQDMQIKKLPGLLSKGFLIPGSAVSMVRTLQFHESAVSSFGLRGFQSNPRFIAFSTFPNPFFPASESARFQFPNPLLTEATIFQGWW